MTKYFNLLSVRIEKHIVGFKDSFEEVEKYILNSKYIHLGIELNWEREKKIYF